MMYMSNRDADEREQILFKRDYNPKNYEAGGIVRFDSLNATEARKLIEKGFLNPNESQNDSPTSEEFVSFIEGCKEPGDWFLHGYAVSPERSDHRITIEGIGTYCEVDTDDVVRFVMMCRFADELDAGTGQSLWCWYD